MSKPELIEVEEAEAVEGYLSIQDDRTFEQSFFEAKEARIKYLKEQADAAKALTLDAFLKIRESSGKKK